MLFNSISPRLVKNPYLDSLMYLAVHILTDNICTLFTSYDLWTHKFKFIAFCGAVDFVLDMQIFFFACRQNSLSLLLRM